MSIITTYTEITVGEGVVVIRQQNSSKATVAQILGERIRDGVRYLYLDRLVHFRRGSQLVGWEASGAISTILSRPVTAETE